jgi:hypothetical protein
LDDKAGNLIDSGKFKEASDMVNASGKAGNSSLSLPITYVAGEKIANLMILPPRQNNTGKAAAGHRLYTVDRMGTLEDFLANMTIEYPTGANIHWSACAEELTNRKRMGAIDANNTYVNLLEYAKIYYESEEKR